MLANLYKRFLPMPKFLRAPSFGLDVSDQSLKFVELLPDIKGVRLVKYGERKIPKGVIESGQIKDSRRLEQLLQSMREEEDIRFVRVSLPEEQVYPFSLRIEKEGLQNVREGIELALEEHVPVPAQDAIFDYDLVQEDDKSLLLQVAVIPQAIIENYLKVFRECFISVQSFEVEAQAIARAVIKKGDLDTYMIVDFGQTRTGIFIVSKGVVMFTSTLNLGGQMLNDVLQKNFKVSVEKAEEMKKKYGLQRNTENQEIFSVLLNSVSVMRDEIQKHLVYWQTHKDDQEQERTPIKKIILTGGDANLIGLPEYLAISTKTKVELGNVWTNIIDTGKHVPEIGFNRSLTFAAALGLALGDFEYD